MDQVQRQTVELLNKLDELKKIMKEKYAHPDVISRIERLEGHYYSDGDLSAIHGCIRNIEKNMEYEAHQTQRLIERINQVEEITKRITEDDMKTGKKPHKCPVCDGFGKQLALIALQVRKCEACNSTGVIWG